MDFLIDQPNLKLCNYRPINKDPSNYVIIVQKQRSLVHRHQVDVDTPAINREIELFKLNKVIIKYIGIAMGFLSTYHPYNLYDLLSVSKHATEPNLDETEITIVSNV